MPRTLDAIDCDLFCAAMRRRLHDDPLSRDGNMRTIDVLLDERLTVAPARKRT